MDTTTSTVGYYSYFDHYYYYHYCRNYCVHYFNSKYSSVSVQVG